MNDMQSITKFAILPNEILIECFEYLNTRDILYAFDCLNYRYSKLVRNIPLLFTFQDVPNIKFHQSCKKILSSPEMKNQIYSLHLSNRQGREHIYSFLSFFSLAEFPHLRSLTLINLDQDNIKQITSMLPLLLNLTYFRWTDSSNSTNQILAALPMSTIKTLFAPKPSHPLKLVGQSMSVVSLTISCCSINQLHQFFKHLPKLKYLSVEKLDEFLEYSVNGQYPNNEYVAAHLKQLIISYSAAAFDLLKKLLEKTPNLSSLTLSTCCPIETMNAYRWQHLITSSLPFLDTFNFVFTTSDVTEHEILNNFQQFQNNFWHQQHQWYTECQFERSRALIYTVPYLSNQYKLTPYIKYYNTLMDTSNTFDNVTCLEVDLQTITVNCKYYFSNVKSLTLETGNFAKKYYYLLLKPDFIRHLQMIVNLSGLNHLHLLPQDTIALSSILLQIIKEAPHLSSLKIPYSDVRSLYDDRILCEYLKKRIKKLYVYWNTFYLSNFSDVEKIGQVFSNLEQFGFNVYGLKQVWLLLNGLAKLPNIKVFLFDSPYQCDGSIHRWLRDNTLELNKESFTIDYEHELVKCRCWDTDNGDDDLAFLYSFVPSYDYENDIDNDDDNNSDSYDSDDCYSDPDY